MISRGLTIENGVGLHARPATFFVQKANSFKSSIWVEKGDCRVNAKSLLGVLLAKKLNWDDLRIVMENDYYHEFDRFIKS